MPEETQTDWLAGPVPEGFQLAEIQRARCVFLGHNNEYVGEVWSAIEKTLRQWMSENRMKLDSSFELEDVDPNPTFMVSTEVRKKFHTCSDFISALASVAEYKPVIDIIKNYSFAHIMASVCLYYMEKNLFKEASRASYWLGRKEISQYKEQKKIANKSSHIKDEKAKKFAQKIAGDTWIEEQECNAPVTHKQDMLNYVSEQLVLDGYKGKSGNETGYSRRIIWEWIKHLAPPEVKKPGRPSKKIV